MKKNISCRKEIIINAIYLLLVQGWGYLIPFLIIPLLISRVGMNGFGIITYITAIVAIFKVAVCYGFDKTAVIDISSNRNDNEFVSNVFSEVIASRLFLIIAGFPIYLTIIYLVPISREHLFISISMYLLVVGEGMIPQWYYQAIGELKYLSLSRVLQKTIYSLCIYFMVTSSNELYLIPLIDGISLLLLSVIFILTPIVKSNINLKLVSFKKITKQLKNSFDVFYSNSLSILQLSINTITLGFLCGNEIVGVYSIAEKIYTAIRGLYIPIAQSILPRAADAYQKDNKRYDSIIFNSIKFYIATSFIAFVFLNLFGSEIIALISKNSEFNSDIYASLSIMSIAIFTSVIGITSMRLVIADNRKEIIKIATIATLLTIILSYPLIYLYQNVGAALCFLFVQIYILVAQVLAYKGKR
ncbi:oligosaccharide flippase family protein [Aliivibrio fischeri]|uniref:Oligosaccharide flippase family protein n=1 Tax=Aliivibrio fischeri TaxID=668 RepID=A0A6N3Z8P8_ALIFS|nr:oligosaccharide flippase family protein [Aliivibrio fischeri]MUK46113.1 oligosaccharide flippase family protein [Aliivibrio fischeri]MUK79247.1 oligosaccharide flippase family protein [Aliivibrio fischeri]MUK85889.1 oligosaccharide flippase family protein [Aliivibrio fischeri]